jgi:putative peptidoglycan lipid II flippase
MGPLAQVGLALATSIGAWINLGLVVWFAHRAGHAGIDDRLRQSALKLAAAGIVMAAVLWFGHAPLTRALSGMHHWQDLTLLIVLGAIAGAVYGAIVLATLGRAWLTRFSAAAPR